MERTGLLVVCRNCNLLERHIMICICFSPQRMFSSVALAFYTICVQKRRKKVDDF